jgi:hypothetical protein
MKGQYAVYLRRTPRVYPEARRAVRAAQGIGHLTLRDTSHSAWRGKPQPASPQRDTHDAIENSLPQCQRECMPLTFDIPGLKSLLVDVDDKK